MDAPMEGRPISRIERLLLSPLVWGAVLLLGVAYRLRQYLHAHSYWYDESFLLLPIRERGFADLLGPQPYNLVIPPLYLWITRLLHLIGGDHEMLMRAPSFLAGIAALFLMVPLARKIVGNAHALWPVALLAVSRHAWAHGCEVRPYTVDLLLIEAVLYCVAILVDPHAAAKARQRAGVGLGLLAAIGPWCSFPSAFAFGGASLALAYHLGRTASRRDWCAWVALNGITAISAVLLWWFSGRHMYYNGMIDHWGHNGWGGFPDWSSPYGIGKWLFMTPIQIGSYGNREMGVLLVPLALVGGFALAKRARSLVILLTVPFVLTVVAALLGKYPIANRTGFFLLPCLWLLAACGISQVVAWGRQRNWELAFVGLVLLVGDLTYVVRGIVTPTDRVDYRGAFEVVHAQRAPSDTLWTEMGVVYETYHGKGSPLLMDTELEQALQRVKYQRLWVIVGDTRCDIRTRFERAGGRIVCTHHVSGLDVLLIEPREQTAAAPSP